MPFFPSSHHAPFHPHARRRREARPAAEAPFAWWCVIRGLFFTYVYGSRPACERALAALDPADCLLKGYCADAAEAEGRARAAAAELDHTYAGLGRSWAVAAEEFPNLPEPRPAL